MEVAGKLRLLAEQHLQAFQAAFIVGQACHGKRGGIARAVRRRFGKTEIDQAVAGKAAVGQHIEQAALAARVDSGQTGQRRALAAIGLDQAHRARLFRYQHAALVEEGQAPWVIELLVEDFNAHGLGMDIERRMHEQNSGRQHGPAGLVAFRHGFGVACVHGFSSA